MTMQTFKRITLGLGAVCLILVASEVNALQLYYMAALLMALPAVSWAMGWLALRGLVVQRSLSAEAWAGDCGELGYLITNPTRLPRYFISIAEVLPTAIVATESEPSLFNVGPQSSTRIFLSVQYTRRGVFALRHVDVAATDPLGIFTYRRRLVLDGRVVVLPRPRPMIAPWLGGGRFGWEEFTNEALTGTSVEMAGVRPWAPGDSLRRVHWGQTARTGNLAVIEFDEVQSMSVVIALDNSGAADGDADAPFEAAVVLAASLAKAAIERGAGVALLCPGEPTDTETENMPAVPSLAPGRLYAILRRLAEVKRDAGSSVSAAIGAHRDLLFRGAALIAVSTEAGEELTDSLRHVLEGGAAVGAMLVQIADDKSEARTVAKGLDRLTAARLPAWRVEFRPEGMLQPEAAVTRGIYG
ncbi:MAG: DUF58 domain-containing protein [Armatimonadetes bacterium]|nr:DUF58 domain-containing protein [Armatimonadota bacterium]MDE2207123.1 DUF58 domain-containing protein [Armatimonadota bacterium]